ncbi:hypothetical protein COU58_00640 [Candidatus Pacearchaeota archaeon CG10_big_fil_rev_8_21_14_0_10_32_42]|nr:MAG: hypothetical protein COU58_00640 [Candidatus Pacearchaeota archaeon CG10_big_fil_rev_8_21_14_0_10_32_42]
MQEILKLFFGVVILTLGIPIGNFLKKQTLDEQKDGQIWFKILITLGILGGFVGLVIKEDWVLFTFFFIAIVSSRNLIINPKK